MSKENKYEQLYLTIIDYEKKLHEKNQRRIKAGLVCMIVIPLIFLVLLFWTGSSKPIFLTLWIVSLFAIAIYLITVEYADYKLQEKLNEFRDDDEAEINALLDIELKDVEKSIKIVREKVEKTLNAEEEVEVDEEHN